MVIFGMQSLKFYCKIAQKTRQIPRAIALKLNQICRTKSCMDMFVGSRQTFSAVLFLEFFCKDVSVLVEKKGILDSSESM